MPPFSITVLQVFLIYFDVKTCMLAIFFFNSSRVIWEVNVIYMIHTGKF